MTVFRAALRLVVRRPALILVYVCLLGVIGVVLMGGLGDPRQVAEVTEIRPTVAVVDQDGSDLSRGLTRQLAARGQLVEIGSSRRDLQDAVAGGAIAYIVVIPAGYQDGFAAAARAAGDLPLLETVVTLESAQARYLDQVADSYLRLVRAGLMTRPEAGMGEALARADVVAGESAEQAVVARPAAKTDASRFRYYLYYAVYPLTAGVLVLAGLVFHSFQGGALRRRNLVAPWPPARMAAQITLATLAICLAAWAWVGALSLLPTAEGLAVLRAAPAQFALAQVAALVYTAAPLALGFFFGQLGVGLGALNGFGNIVSLAFAFLGGAFTIGLEATGAMAVIGQFTPAHWHVKAVDQAFAWSQGTWVGVGPYLGALGVELLFAAAVAAVGLVIGRLRASRRGGGAGESSASVAPPAEEAGA